MVFMPLCILTVRLGKAACCTWISYSTLARVKEHRAELWPCNPLSAEIWASAGEHHCQNLRQSQRHKEMPKLPHFISDHL